MEIYTSKGVKTKKSTTKSKAVKASKVPSFQLYDDLCRLKKEKVNVDFSSEEVSEYASSVSFDQRVMIAVLIIHYYSVKAGYVVQLSDIKPLTTSSKNVDYKEKYDCVDHDTEIKVDMSSLDVDLQHLISLYVSRSIN